MIYIENENTISVPRHTFEEYDQYSLTLYSKMSSPIVLVDGKGNMSVNSFYYQFPIIIPTNMQVGEYNYELTSNGSILESGLLTFGNYNREGLVSAVSSNNKVQYNGKH